MQTSDWQLSSIAQVCNSIIPPLSTLETLRIDQGSSQRVRWYGDMADTQWLELLQPFTRVKDLVISGRLVRLVAPALQELTGERVTEMLPMPQKLFLEGPRPSGAVKEAIEKFIAARQLSGYPVTVNSVGPDSKSESMTDSQFDMAKVSRKGGMSIDIPKFPFDFDIDRLGDVMMKDLHTIVVPYPQVGTPTKNRNFALF